MGGGGRGRQGPGRGCRKEDKVFSHAGQCERDVTHRADSLVIKGRRQLAQQHRRNTMGVRGLRGAAGRGRQGGAGLAGIRAVGSKGRDVLRQGRKDSVTARPALPETHHSTTWPANSQKRRQYAEGQMHETPQTG